MPYRDQDNNHMFRKSWQNLLYRWSGQRLSYRECCGGVVMLDHNVIVVIGMRSCAFKLYIFSSYQV